jgi:RND superfamily putative drug exporter
MPANAPANIGYAAAERHFSQARLNPELLMIEANHDLRNPTDMILLERVAKAVFHTDGIAEVQSITRPLGTPLDHTSIPFQISAGNSGQIENLPFQQARAADLLNQVNVIDKSIDVLRQQYALQQQSSALTDEQAQAFHTRSPRPRTCATRLPTSTTSSGPCAATSTGRDTVSTSRPAPRCGRSSTRSTASTC